MTISDFAHVGILVSDLSPAQRLFGHLGLEVQGPETDDELGIHLLWVKAGETVLEFIAPAREDSRAAEAVARGEAGVHHVALSVDNLEAELADLRAAGFAVRDDAPRQGAHGTQIAFLEPDEAGGALIELVEP